MAAIEDEELEQEFDAFGVLLDDLVITDRLKEICGLYKWSASHLVEEWMAFSATRSMDLTLESVKEFKGKLSSDQRNKLHVVKTEPRSNKIYNKDNFHEVFTDTDLGMMEVYQTPETKTSIKRLHTTPESTNKMLHTLNGRTPSTFSPMSVTPSSATPAKRYETRQNAGEILFTFNPGGISEKDIKFSGSKKDLRITSVEDKPLTEKFKYMFQKIMDKSQVLNDLIDKMASILKEAHNVEEFTSATSISQDDVSVVGQVCCDTNGRLNASSLMLRESGSSSSGCSVPLHVQAINQYSLFPGQIVAVKGRNPTGMKFVASSFYESVLPQPFESECECTDTLSVFVAVGPFTTTESVFYEPLSDFLNKVLQEKPDVVIMIGPFVDAKNELVKKCELKETFQELFSRTMKSVGNCAKSLSTTFIVVPSQRDVHHEFVYPQPPFSAKDIVNTLNSITKKHIVKQESQKAEKENVANITPLCFCSDPCTIEVNGFTFGLTSTDVMLHLGSEEVSYPPGSSDKMARLVKHILTQHCYYPLFPPSEDVCIDYEAFSRYGGLPCKPDVLIVPSDLKYFVKNVFGCLSINPGRLTKGLVGGSYCRMLLKKDKALPGVVKNSVVQIVKI